jgi:hypothetical protein
LRRKSKKKEQLNLEMNLYFLNLVQSCRKNEREKNRVDDGIEGFRILNGSKMRTMIETKRISVMTKIRYKRGLLYRGISCWPYDSYCFYDGPSSYQDFDFLLVANLKQKRGRNSIHRSILDYQRLF